MLTEKSKNYQFFSTVKDALDAMYKEIQQAKKSVYWETYIFENDDAGRRFIELLCAKAREGVEVKVILDGFGSFWMAEKMMEKLEKSGAEVLYFNPLQLSGIWGGIRRWLERNHRKVLIVDETVGFIGGVNVDEESRDWFDLHVRVTGQIVSGLLKYFGRTYLASGGVVNRIKYFLYLPIVKQRYWRLMWHRPRENYSSIHNVYIKAIQSAKKSLTLVSPYFLPDSKIISALAEAKRKGVKINLILPKETDHRLLTYAGRTYWSVLYNLGIKVYLVKKMIHAKAMMVDDKWAMVGSSNFDAQTFYRSYETNLIFTSQQMIKDLKVIFKGWRKQSRLFRPVKWARRSLFHRVYEFFGRLLRQYL
ncbi:MAG: phosphatidylserine/phosphatidylglycerophosphate/cardiolipin synthase family protein [Patescibacteria group bacterium]